MKSLGLCLLAACLSVPSFAPQKAAPSSKPCRIVDVTLTGKRYEYFVDGQKVSPDVGMVFKSLQRAEAAQPCSCLRVFVPLPARFRDVADFQVIAGKMQYEEFHAYLYEQRSAFDNIVQEISWQTYNAPDLRRGVAGNVDWPDSPSTGTK